MAGRIQDSDVKDATEAGAASRLINDTKIYVTGTGLNKTLYQAITDGNLSGGGSGGLTVTATKTANYTAAANELVVCNASGGGFTVTLPAASGNSGKRVGVLKIVTDTSFNQITVNGKKLNTFGEYMEFISDGSSWLTILHRCSTPWTSYTMTVGATTTAPTTTGTGTTITTEWMRDERNILIKGRVFIPLNATGNAPGSGVYLFPLPSGVTAASNVYTDTNTTNINGQVVGTLTNDQSGGSVVSGGVVAMYNSSNMKLYSQSSGYIRSASFAFDVYGATTFQYNWLATIPATDWE